MPKECTYPPAWRDEWHFQGKTRCYGGERWLAPMPTTAKSWFWLGFTQCNQAPQKESRNMNSVNIYSPVTSPSCAPLAVANGHGTEHCCHCDCPASLPQELGLFRRDLKCIYTQGFAFFFFYRLPFNGPLCRVNGLLVQNPSPWEDKHILACWVN